MDYVIIVAGGKGLRMGGDVPKQFMDLAGQPVLMHTIDRFYAYDERMQIILVLPEEQHEYWHRLCAAHAYHTPHTVVSGGDTRYESSKNGLAAVPDDARGVVAIHDGVRPLVSADTIERCVEAAREEFAAIPVMPVTSTLRYVDAHGAGRNVQRSDYREVQTPQVFDIQLAKQAFRQPAQSAFTDDATVVESLGCQVQMVAGNVENIKLTTPFDIVVAEALLNKKA